MLFPCARHVILYLVLVQPRICSDITDFFLLGCKLSTSNNRGPQLLSASALDMYLKDCYLEKTQCWNLVMSYSLLSTGST